MAIKQYTIGRSADCTINIYDDSQQVSRNHATLTVVSERKIYITDHSTNGTYVNGVKVSTGNEYPIQRGDVISFANVAYLNWDMVPKSGNAGMIMIIVAVVLLVIGGGVGFYIYNSKSASASSQSTAIIGGEDAVTYPQSGSGNNDVQRELEEEGARKRDEIKQKTEEEVAKKNVKKVETVRKEEVKEEIKEEVKKEQKQINVVF